MSNTVATSNRTRWCWVTSIPHMSRHGTSKEKMFVFIINPGVLGYALAQDDMMERLINIDEFPLIVEKKSQNEPVYLFLIPLSV